MPLIVSRVWLRELDCPRGITGLPTSRVTCLRLRLANDRGKPKTILANTVIVRTCA